MTKSGLMTNVFIAGLHPRFSWASEPAAPKRQYPRQRRSTSFPRLTRLQQLVLVQPRAQHFAAIHGALAAEEALDVGAPQVLHRAVRPLAPLVLWHFWDLNDTSVADLVEVIAALDGLVDPRLQPARHPHVRQAVLAEAALRAPSLSRPLQLRAPGERPRRQRRHGGRRCGAGGALRLGEQGLGVPPGGQ
eukprot:CAMPEP_0174382776 /NCGR_PEP_ID=MMETSP0811_2-20130205/124798_1 /TAXON_ID=73025 ORGANISM="Eutreptiella gymnastica-like, Strain CCMP1594" /NCGR_SAMPLE_ID=MMETSP0811_2 /ASSEMBLY_ACC=CAM_ASM_000667 /LENGTH=189 /DNA_ID=CAMNT_0015536153 /DNA_START=2078 /DNA_END=2644 /DNA_ORIENTATION=+